MTWLDRLIALVRPAPRPVVPPGPGPPIPSPPSPGATAARDLLAAVNRARMAAGLPALAADARLERTAAAQATHCARIGQLTHTGPGGSSPWDRIRAAGVPYPGVDAQENGAAFQTSAEQVVSDWRNEKPPNDGHRKNVYDRRWTHAGGGAAAGKDGRLWWFCDFAREVP